MKVCVSLVMLASISIMPRTEKKFVLDMFTMVICDCEDAGGGDGLFNRSKYMTRVDNELENLTQGNMTFVE